VYPLVDLILVRDGRTAPPLLSALGVDDGRVVFTGDDAIELVYTARTSHPGQAIGVSLRRSHYTLVGTEDMDVIRAVLQQAAAKRNTKLKPVPISYSSHEMDENVIQGLLAGGRTVFARRRRFQTPVQIVKSVGGCRLVVTGAFHAAVFALAQGIPAVGLARTSMYLDKFQSLADQFGTACQPVHLGGEDLATRLERAIDFAWNAADDLRPGLLEAAQRHIALGRAGYRRLHELVEPRPHRPVAGIS
jgi:colanic acid/amylovoran biosynthesis protein